MISASLKKYIAFGKDLHEPVPLSPDQKEKEQPFSPKRPSQQRNSKAQTDRPFTPSLPGTVSSPETTLRTLMARITPPQKQVSIASSSTSTNNRSSTPCVSPHSSTRPSSAASSVKRKTGLKSSSRPIPLPDDITLQSVSTESVTPCETDTKSAHYQISKETYDFFTSVREVFEHVAPLKGQEIAPVIGFTGAGKSTIAAYLEGIPLTFNEEEELTIVSDEASCRGRIGHGYQSQSIYPRASKLAEFHVVDFPGFKDTRENTIHFKAELGMFLALRTAKSIHSLLFVIQWSIITAERGVGFKERLSKLLDIIPYQESHFPNTRLIINQAPTGLTKAGVDATLSKFHQTLTHTPKLYALLCHLLQQKPIVFNHETDDTRQEVIRTLKSAIPQHPSSVRFSCDKEVKEALSKALTTLHTDTYELAETLNHIHRTINDQEKKIESLLTEINEIKVKLTSSLQRQEEYLKDLRTQEHKWETDLSTLICHRGLAMVAEDEQTSTTLNINRIEKDISRVQHQLQAVQQDIAQYKKNFYKEDQKLETQLSKLESEEAALATEYQDAIQKKARLIKGYPDAIDCLKSARQLALSGVYYEKIEIPISFFKALIPEALEPSVSWYDTVQ